MSEKLAGISEIVSPILVFSEGEYGEVIPGNLGEAQLATPSDAPAPYVGPCRCKEIRESSHRKPFRPETIGKQFPPHCFVCACNVHWWEFFPEGNMWGVVDNEETWKQIVEARGTPAKPIGWHPSHHTLCLTEVIHAEGLVPG